MFSDYIKLLLAIVDKNVFGACKGQEIYRTDSKVQAEIVIKHTYSL